MSQARRVLNITKGCYKRYSQALQAIEIGACAWVEEGVSIRNLTIAESIAFRNDQAKQREPLAYAEDFALIFNGPLPNRYDLIKQAHEFVANGA